MAADKTRLLRLRTELNTLKYTQTVAETVFKNRRDKLTKRTISQYQVTKSGSDYFMWFRYSGGVIPDSTNNRDHFIENLGKFSGVSNEDWIIDTPGSSGVVKFKCNDIITKVTSSWLDVKGAYFYFEADGGTDKFGLTADGWNYFISISKTSTNFQKLTADKLSAPNDEWYKVQSGGLTWTQNNAPPTYFTQGNTGIDFGLFGALQHFSPAQFAGYLYWYWQWFGLKAIPKKLAELNKESIAVTGKPVSSVPVDGGSTDDTPTIPSSTGTNTFYNLPSVKESYFKNHNSTKASNFSENVLFLSTDGNTPAKIAEAKELWATAGSHKGMIQSFVFPGNLASGSKWLNPQAKGIKGKNVNANRYGFQFLYNPSTVSMHYAGAPQVDIGLEMSGTDKVPLIGSSVTSSSVSFQLLINRMPDFVHLQDLKGNLGPSGLVDVDKASSAYPWIVPAWTKSGKIAADPRTMSAELEKIRTMGTMYDVEYLLRTLIGYVLPSNLRGGTLTADIGYLGAYPVELHLGKKLRYLGTIDSINANHTIFTKDMIPVFTNLEVTFNRLPEYQNYQSNYATTGGVKK